MLLKASERAGGQALATHLLNAHDNDHVEVHELRGFISDTLHGAFQEIEAHSKGTRCKNYLFSLSLNPPEKESVGIEAFQDAVNRIEAKLGLSEQARAMVFHEKQGRRHAHCVWSRIDVQEMKAVQLPYFKMKLQDIAKELYLEHGWKMPKGFENKSERNPFNYTLAEWHQAQRVQEDPQALKALFKDSWDQSKNGEALIDLLKAKGYTVAQGDKSGAVAVDYQGEVYSLSRWAGVKSKELKAKFGEQQQLVSVAQAKEQIANTMTDRLKTYANTVKEQSLEKQHGLKTQKTEMVSTQRQEREKLQAIQTDRWTKESQERQAKIPQGWRKVWSFVKGELKTITKENEQAILQAKERDRQQKQALIDRQREERLKLQEQFRALKQDHQKQMDQLKTHLAKYQAMQRPKVQEQPKTLTATFNHAKQADKAPAQPPPKNNGHGKGHNTGGEGRSLSLGK
jgi:hypothetical protein